MYRPGYERLESSPAERDLAVLVASKLNLSQQHALAAKRANHSLGCISHGIASRLRERIVLLCTALVQSHLQYVCSFGHHSIRMT